jgi:hypothetical protein
MKAKIKKGRNSSSNKVNPNILVVDLDINQKWIVNIVDSDGKSIKSRMRYTDRELLHNYDLKIEVHNHVVPDEE